MKKTLEGSILSVLLVWCIYFFFVARDRLYNTLELSGRAGQEFLIFIIIGVISLGVLFLMFRNSVRDKAPKNLMDRLKANTTLSEEDERERKIAAEASKKGYIFISNAIIIFMVLASALFKDQTFSVNQIIFALAVFVTFESILFFYFYYELYTK